MEERVKNSVLGMMIADALAMPVHWYYTPRTIERDFGPDGVQFYEKPLHPHPDAFAYSMTYEGTIDIFHGVERHIRKEKPPPEENVHYHYGLQAGDITLQMQLARQLLKCLDKDGVERSSWQDEFVSYCTTPSPALQNDVYRDVFIRRFFERLSDGRPLPECPISQKECWSVGSMGGVIPALLVALSFACSSSSQTEMLQRAMDIHLKTHNSENVSEAARVLCPLVVDLVRTTVPPDASYDGDPAEPDLEKDGTHMIDPRRRLILQAARAMQLPAVTGASLLKRYNEARGPGNIPKDEMYQLHTARRPTVLDPSLYMNVPDEHVIGRQGFVGTVCYTEHGVPAVLFLAYKYFDSPETALIRNANLLGDSTSRGALLGCILGAAHGGKCWPDQFVEGLRESNDIQQEAAAFASRVV